MHFKNVSLESIGHHLPSEVWTSESIEEKLRPLYERLKLPFGRIELMTGIKERRFWDESFRPSALAAKAAEDLLSKSAIKKSEVDILIHSSVCRDRLEPATAAYVHQLLGLPSSTQFFDVSNACLGFMNAMMIAGSMIDSGQIKVALIVSAENGRPLLEHTIKELLEKNLSRNEVKPYFANFTIGGGAAAALLCHSSIVDSHLPRIVAGCIETDTASNILCEGGNVGGTSELEMLTDSEQLLEAGIALSKKTWDKFKSITSWENNTPRHFICHQVGQRHRTHLFKTLELDETKDFSTFETLGNIGSASLPVTLAKAIESGKIVKNDPIALLGIGSGLSSAMLALEW